MLDTFFHKIGIGFAVIGSVFGLNAMPQEPMVEPALTPEMTELIDQYLQRSTDNAKDGLPQVLGVSAPESLIAGSTYNLAGGGVSSSATSITLASLTIPQTGQKIQDSDLADTFYLTLEPGNRTRQEIVSCTTITQNASNATLSGCSRGLSPITPYTASTTLAFVHAGGSQVIFSDPPQIFEDIIDYIDDVALSGAPNASLTQKGIVELATQLETASSSATGSTGASLVIPASYASSTYTSATAGYVIPTTQQNGKLDSNFVATSTLFGSGAGQGLATTTAIGSFPAYQIGMNRQIITTTGTSTFAIPSGISKLWVEVLAGGGAGGGCSAGASNASGGGGGGAGGYSQEIVDVSATSTVQTYVGAAGERTTFGTIGSEFLSATAGSAGTESVGGDGGTGSGGDINIVGADGDAGALDEANTNGADQYGGTGGSSMYGGGGRGVTVANNNGTNAGNYGSGGGGGACDNGSASGGTGSQGLLIIRW